MTSKKTRGGLGKRRKAKTVLKLSRRAQAETARLLRRDRAGTITRLELNTGLKEIKTRLKVMVRLINKIL
jgi:hypothetical protein